MNKNQFLNKYMPLIGKKVNDKHFNVQKLTKTSILNKCIELFYFNKMQIAYIEKDYFDICLYLEEIINLCHYLGINEAIEWSKFELFAHSIGNSKIGNDTLCISFNSGLLCYMALCGQCKNCGICYAKNSNKMYSNEFLKNTINQKVLCDTYFEFDNAYWHNIVKNTIYSINCAYSENQLKNLKFLRINVNGDLLDNWQLAMVDNLAKYICQSFDLICAYSYTHNKELDIDNVFILFNCSDFEGKKQTMTKFKFDIEWLTSDNVILCNGNCLNCPYCKSKFENRKIIFLAHGGQFEGLDAVDSYLISYLEYNKQNDYLMFMRQLAMV